MLAKLYGKSFATGVLNAVGETTNWKPQRFRLVKFSVNEVLL
jgi:hypothetical protein